VHRLSTHRSPTHQVGANLRSGHDSHGVVLLPNLHRPHSRRAMATMLAALS